MTQWQTIQIPLAAGMAQNQDDRALQPPSLAVAKDVEFEEVGGVQTRKPLVALGGPALGNVGTAIFGGGNLADVRELVPNGDELLCFTKDTLYSWNDALNVWVSKATHLAIAVDEKSVFATTVEQTQCDRAELNGTIIYAWYSGSVYVAAVDKTTGAILMAPTILAGAIRPRVVATTTKIMLFALQPGGQLVCLALNPAAPATAMAGATTVLIGAGAAYFDVCKRAGADACYVGSTLIPTTSYTALTVTAALVVVSSTKVRVCDGPIGVASHPLGTHVQVIRADGVNIKGDLLTSALVDVNTATAIGAADGLPVSQIACEYSAIAVGGQYRCWTWWSGYETNDIVFIYYLRRNYVDTAAATGSTASADTKMVAQLSLGSRAFYRDGHVYVFALFAQGNGTAGSGFGHFTAGAQLQDTYFLYREDDLLCGKAVAARAGGFDAPTNGGYVSTIGHLPGVTLVDTETYAWCAQERRITQVSLDPKAKRVYSARTPRDVALTFDSDRARRTVRLGRTLYLAGGTEVMQYDGSKLVEVGFHVYPWSFGLGGTFIAGALVDGTYSYKNTYGHVNAQGERDRSTTAQYVDATVTGGPKGVEFLLCSGLSVTHRTAASSPAVIESWRSVKDAGSAIAPYYLVSSRDPAKTQPNGFNANVPNANSTFQDILVDATILTQEENDEVGTVLENVAPPASHIIKETQDRIFLADIAGDPDRVWYSKTRGDGQVASFNDYLSIAIPPKGGSITALAILSETLVVFRERAVYLVPGEGFANDQSGQNYGPVRVLSEDCGAESAEAVGKTDVGIVFKGPKGWYLLTPGWQLQYIGASVVDYDAEAVLSIDVLEDRHQVRVLTAARMLVWDHLVNQWCEWTFSGGIAACMWRGAYVAVRVNPSTLGLEVVTEADDFSDGDVTYGLDVETPWIKPQDLQGRVRVRWSKLLGEFRSACSIRLRVARDYKTRTTATLITTAISASIAGGNGVLTSDRPWRARIASVGAACSQLWIAFAVDAAGSVEVRDNQVWNGAAWVASVGSLGILVKGQDAGAQAVAVAMIEAAITASSAIATVERSDNTSFKTVAISTLAGLNLHGDLEAGVDWFDDIVWIATPTTVGGPLELRHGPTEGRVSAIKFRITARGAIYTPTNPPQGEALKLTGLALDVAVAPGINRRLPAAQKT